MTIEKAIELQICAWLRSKGIEIWKMESTGVFDPTRKVFRRNFNPYKRKGVSDVLGILEGGRLLAIEVKAPKGRVTPEQKAFIAMVNQKGGKAFIARSVEDVMKEFENVAQ